MITSELLAAGPTCFSLQGALGAQECQDLIQCAERQGFEPMAHHYPKNYRCNDRLVLDDAALAQWLWQRVEAHLPALSGARPLGLNPRFRFCRYRGGQSFCLHRDGAWSPTASTRTRLTLQIYLNDGSEFEGGETTFTLGALRVVPQRGMAMVFDHTLWHAGQAVPRGTKYVLRSDVIYPLPAASTATLDPIPALAPTGLQQTARYDGHLGYVWQALPLCDGRIASGSRDGTLRLWPAAEIVRREPSSITALAEKLDGRLVHGTREQGVLCLAVLADGSLAAGMTDGTLRIGERSLPLATSWLWCVTQTQPGQVAVGTDSGEIVVIDTGTLTVVERKQLPAPVRALTRLHDGRLLAGLGTGQLWYAANPWDAGQWHTAHAQAITGVCEVAPGAWATSSEDNSIAVWNAASCTRLARAAHDDFARSIAMTSDGQLVSASYDGSVRCWALSNGSGS